MSGSYLLDLKQHPIDPEKRRADRLARVLRDLVDAVQRNPNQRYYIELSWALDNAKKALESPTDYRHDFERFEIPVAGHFVVARVDIWRDGLVYPPYAEEMAGVIRTLAERVETRPLSLLLDVTEPTINEKWIRR